MATPNLAQLCAEAIEEGLRTTPDPFKNSWLFDLLTGHRTLYRDELDRQPVNMMGEVIPRIATVRRHLVMLGNIRMDPNRIP